MGHYRRPASNPFDALGAALAITLGVICFVPFIVAVEVKAWLARHRIRKEQAASQVKGE